MIRRHLPKLFGATFITVLHAAACGSGSEGDGSEPNDSKTGDHVEPGDEDTQGGDDAFGDDDDGGAGTNGDTEGRDPVDCAEAQEAKSYVGCDYWPTITPNGVFRNKFNFAVVVANTGKTPAAVTVTGPASFSASETVPAGGLVTIKLPWVADLKGNDHDSFLLAPPTTVGAVSKGGAYHLVSSSPVIVYQFNPLEFKSSDGSGSYSNDASLLLPSTAMRNVYRVAGMHGWTVPVLGSKARPVLSITATADKTNIQVHLSKTGGTETSGPLPATPGGSTLTFSLNKGDVASIVGKEAETSDLSGSIVEASAPVQVITSVPCIYLPAGTQACDHVEESLIPAEAFGKKYVIAIPTGFDGKPVAHVVRLYGNAPGTKLTYTPTKPAGCPDTLEAGGVADCGVVESSFMVEGTKEFTVQSFLLGAAYYDGTGSINTQNMGDPSQTSYPAIEQFRKNYVFLAPTDYPVRWADVTASKGTMLKVDGAPTTAKFEPIGDGALGVFRVDLTKSGGSGGTHGIEASKPVAVQVIGYAPNTTFMYPAGLNLNLIAEPPAVN